MNLFYRFTVTPVRGSVVNAAAYLSGHRYRDDRLSLVFDHSARRAADRDEVAYVNFLSPAITPLLPEALWNTVSMKNKHPKAVRGRIIVAAFPSVLTLEQMVECAMKYAESLVRCYRVAVHLAIHVPRQRGADNLFDPVEADANAATTNCNWHAHFLLSYCEIDAMGRPGCKQLGLDPVSSRCNGLPNFCKVERPSWSAEINGMLQRIGIADRVDHRSLADRGLPYEPTRPLGPQRWALEQQGISTDIGMHNAGVCKRNAERRRRIAEVDRMMDVERTLAAACREHRGRLQRRARGQFPWNRRTLSEDVFATLQYVNKRAGVVATLDGGRFIDFGRDALLVNLGSNDQVLAMLWHRDQSRSRGEWTIDGPTILMTRANAYFKQRRTLAQKDSLDRLVAAEQTLQLIPDTRGDDDAAATESARRLSTIAGLGALRHASSVEPMPQRRTAPDSQDDDVMSP